MSAEKSPLTVIKVGGSLLTWSELGTRLHVLLSERLDVRPVLVIGGGPIVDALRILAGIHQVPEPLSHQLAIHLMKATSSFLAHLLPDSGIVEHPGEADVQWRAGRIPVLNVEQWLKQHEAEADSLPKTWDTTSDSLAALVARTWRAEQLWLLKSTELPEGMSIRGASDAGLVDKSFPHAAAGVPQGWWCNLRADKPILRRWW